MIYKKGDKSLPTNYRGITIMPVIVKLYLKLLSNRLIPVLDPHLRKNQHGFRSGRSTAQLIFALRRLVEESEKWKSPLVLVFIDLVKAFDTIEWSKLWEILCLYRVPTSYMYITALKSVYHGSGARVRSNEGVSDIFYFAAGVKQGCVLSPYLFNICLVFIFRSAFKDITHLGVEVQSRNGSRSPGLSISDFDFADDTCVVSQCIQNAQTLVTSLELWMNKVGLNINVAKSEVITINCSGRYLGIRRSSQSCVILHIHYRKSHYSSI